MIQWWHGHYVCYCGPHKGVNTPTQTLVGKSPSRWQATIWWVGYLGMHELWCRPGCNELLNSNWQWQHQAYPRRLLHWEDGSMYHHRWQEDQLSCPTQDTTAYSGSKASNLLAKQAQVGWCHVEQYQLPQSQGSLSFTWSSSMSKDLQDHTWMA